MKTISYICLSLVLAFSLAGCGEDKEKAKEDKGKETTKTASKTEQNSQSRVAAAVNDDKRFNHTASLKMQQIVAGITEIQEPIAVVYEKHALIAYRLKDQTKAEQAEKKLKQKLKTDMPGYQVSTGTHPDWYEQVAILHQETIDSGGKTMKNLKASFDILRKKTE